MPRTKPTPTPFSDFHLDFTPMGRRRRWLNLSQRQLANAIGIHPVSQNRVENNRGEPSMRQIVAAAKALGVPVWELFEVVDNK